LYSAYATGAGALSCQRTACFRTRVRLDSRRSLFFLLPALPPPFFIYEETRGRNRPFFGSAQNITTPDDPWYRCSMDLLLPPKSCLRGNAHKIGAYFSLSLCLVTGLHSLHLLNLIAALIYTVDQSLSPFLKTIESTRLEARFICCHYIKSILRLQLNRVIQHHYSD
jgi:hypothetical protein